LRKFFNSLSDSSGAPGNYCHSDPAAVVEQTITDLSPCRVRPVEPNGIEVLDFNRPPAAPAFHPEQFAWTAHLLEGQPWPSGGARVPEKGLQLRPEGDRRFWGSAAGRMPAFPSALRLAFATIRVVIHAR
jgi:hypothetical protein